ncbi:hypothetical protein RUND412_005983 [Rhizina undulata]
MVPIEFTTADGSSTIIDFVYAAPFLAHPPTQTSEEQHIVHTWSKTKTEVIPADTKTPPNGPRPWCRPVASPNPREMPLLSRPPLRLHLRMLFAIITVDIAHTTERNWVPSGIPRGPTYNHII